MRFSERVLADSDTASVLDRDLRLLGELCAQMHAGGLNMRLLGRVRHCVADESVRHLLLVEAVARVAKNSMRALLRREARRSGVPSSERFNRLALDFLNLVLSPHTDAAAFWSDLEAQAEYKFVSLFLRSKDDADAKFVAPAEQMVGIRHLLLVRRVLALLAIDIDARAQSQLEAALGEHTLGTSPGFALVQPDLREQRARVKHIGLVAYADAMQLFYSALDASGDSRRRLLLVTQAKLEAARLSMVSDKLATFQLARTLQLLAASVEDAKERGALLERASSVFIALRAERIDPSLNASIVVSPVVLLLFSFSYCYFFYKKIIYS